MFLSHPCTTLSFFFFNDTATTEIYTLSLHDALPISRRWPLCSASTRTQSRGWQSCRVWEWIQLNRSDRKSTRLNSSHLGISYAVFCLKKKKKKMHKKKKEHHRV